MVDLNPFYTNSWAIVVGINEYKYVNTLNYAVNDAQAFSEILVSDFQFPKENVVNLINGDASKESILDSYYSLRNKTSSDDRGIIFFAGHGMTIQGTTRGAGFLIPVDGDPAKLGGLIGWDELTRYSDLIPAKHLLFVMDACYSGLALQRTATPGGQRFVTDMIQRSARQVICAGKADQPVSDSGDGKNSLFTSYLLKGLKGEAQDQNHILTANGLMNFAYQHVSQDLTSNQTPHYGHFSGDGDFIFSTPSNEHLNVSPSTDFLVAIQPNYSFPIEKKELKPNGFHTSRGFGNPQSAEFGRNDLTENLVESRGNESGRQFSRAFSWMSVTLELPGEYADLLPIDKMFPKMSPRVIASANPFERFVLPSESYTTLNTLVQYDWMSDKSNWISFIRIENNGNFEFSDSYYSFYEWKNDRIFDYVQIVGLFWQSMFFCKTVLKENNYNLGASIQLNLIGTKNTYLGGFSKEKGKNGDTWRQLFDGGYLDLKRQTELKCTDANIQLNYDIVLKDLDEISSKKIVDDVAAKLGRAYNHRSSPRCFNFNTDIFPWNQYLSGRQY